MTLLGTLLGSGGQRDSFTTLPHSGAQGSGTPLVHRHLGCACGGFSFIP